MPLDSPMRLLTETSPHLPWHEAVCRVAHHATLRASPRSQAATAEAPASGVPIALAPR